MNIIRFRAAPERPTKCRIKIAVAVDDAGNWVAHGSSDYQAGCTIDELLEDETCHLDGDAKQQYWLIVDVPLPPSEVLAARVDKEED